ncbi:hypothetical protein L6452_09531 [Arctium lappa]|uniref:Uncharacterized protein n=1 Tax=Arctium lappa TaxID=4217 RepID=A0ACB9DLH0_ARCLA|nr:hypothetical protein L6452_09531 [Arctium lappa]
MNPDNYQLAVQECSELVQQGIIEPTISPWACEAFYVNKRSKQVRGKLRLVINYQPLNHFLADDKFPLPQKRSLFQSLANSKAFQKAMVKIFEPILQNALVYIDDILLFSPDEDSHISLLFKFHSIIQQYGIMLSEKKMEIGVPSINFLGMKIFDWKYQPLSHIAQELHRFPDVLSSQKEVQQFPGLVNYMADFLSKLSHHTVHLFPMLKKGPSLWAERQTIDVRAIKEQADKMPPLKIPTTTDKRILQTYASDEYCDEYWGAVLLAQDDKGVRTIYGYKSGTLKASEQHYHSTFKEIVAVKRGIEKFQFHFIGHCFQIEMDMSSFPLIIQFKRKMLPEAQLLRWANWFSQWKFTVKHIKGSENILADFLSRPKHYKYSGPERVPQHMVIPLVFAMDKDNYSSSTPQEASRTTTQYLPEEVTEVIADVTLSQRLPKEALCFFCRSFQINHTRRLLEIRNDLASANNIVPHNILTQVIEGVEIWPDIHPDVALWKETLNQWFNTHLAKSIDSSEDDFDISDNEDDYVFLNDESYDPYEDDPSHPDSRWK